MPDERGRAVASLADLIAEVASPHPVRVAIDGPDAAGKTMLAKDLAAALEERGTYVIHASIDGFHRPRAERYRRGADSPEGYYHDSFDYGLLREALLEPLGPGGSRSFRRRVYDYRIEAPTEESAETAPDDAVLLVDGVFLLRPELVDSWDVWIFVTAAFDETRRRALVRDRDLFGTEAEVERRYRTRYIPGQRLYFAEAQPIEAADVVVENDDPAQPAIRVKRARAR